MSRRYEGVRSLAIGMELELVHERSNTPNKRWSSPFIHVSISSSFHASGIMSGKNNIDRALRREQLVIKSSIGQAGTHIPTADSTNANCLSYSHGGIGFPVESQRIILRGNGRLRNQCGANFPMPPTRMARPRTAAPIFFMNAMVRCLLDLFVSA